MQKLAKWVVFGAACGLSALFACSSDGHPPLAGESNNDAALGNGDANTTKIDGSSTQDGAAVDANLGDGAALPLSCSNGILDGAETDVDCGGNVCNKCIDGKTCDANTDCVGNFCDPTSKKCITPTCNDNKTNGNESDVDCGGGTCAKCSFGKKCDVSTDCVSGSCDTTSKQCDCPPRMVVVATNGKNGGAYCMDETEVPNGDYDRFVRANQSISQQIPVCANTNTSYVPSGAWPPAQPLSVGYPLPVRYVDWCDAYAFCLWAGKSMCGKIGGGPVPSPEMSDGGDAGPAAQDDTSQDSWFNACTAEGANVFPYGSTFTAGICNVDGASTGPWAVDAFNDDGSYSSLPQDLTGTHFRTCQGGTTGLYGMSGNVAEWEDSCTDQDVVSDAGAPSCLARGGSFDSTTQADAECASARLLARTAQLEDVGFRCCQY